MIVCSNIWEGLALSSPSTCIPLLDLQMVKKIQIGISLADFDCQSLPEDLSGTPISSSRRLR